MTEQLSNFEKVLRLGKGGFTTSYRVTRKSDNADFVLKEVNTSLLRLSDGNLRLEEAVKREFANMKSLEHPNIIQAFSVFEDRNVEGQKCLYMTVQYCDSGTFQDIIMNAIHRNVLFKEVEILRWAFQLASAIKYIHSRQFVHRNIQPGNIFMSNRLNDVKLGYFGTAKCLESLQQLPSSKTFLVAAEYMAPEFLTRGHDFCEKCDIYSLGATLHQVISLTRYPVLGRNLNFPSRSNQFFSEDLRNFVKNLVAQEESLRFSTAQMFESSLMTQAADVARYNAELKSSRSNSLPSKKIEVLPKVTSQWISTIIERPRSLLLFGYGGDLVSISKNGESVFWRSKITTFIAGIWHVAIDESRKRLFISYHWKFDVANTKPVDLYVVDISKWSEQVAPETSPITPELYFHKKNWQCYSLTIQPDNDVILISDWFHGKIGAWKLGDLGAISGGENIEPFHVISKVCDNFRPTRCALLPTGTKGSRLSSGIVVKAVGTEGNIRIPLSQQQGDSYYLAVSDWLNNAIYLLEVVFNFDETLSVQFLRKIASKGRDIVGKVRGPVDVKFDLASESLVVCDQGNCRVQCFVPNGSWPRFRAKATTETFKKYFSALSIQGLNNDDELKVLAGLGNGDLVRCNISLE